LSTLTVDLLEEGGEPAWDDFAQQAPDATLFHLSGWRRVIEKAFGHRTFYLVARRGSDICGVLPLTQIKSALFGNSLISNAFCVQGGVVASELEAGERLRAEAVRIARELKVDCVEIRAASGAPQPWQTKSGVYAIFRRPLAPDAESNFKSIPKLRRKKIRKAMNNGLTSKIDSGVDQLHHVYAQSVRRLGTPVFSKRYFRLLKEAFGSSCEVLTVMHKSDPVASSMIFYFRDRMMTYYGGGDFDARSLAANDFMYWEIIQRGCERGARVFDFGRSKIGTGSYDFKHEWGFEPTPLTYEYFLQGSQKIPEINPLNPKYQLAIKVWQRLPLSITKLIGPAIVRSIG
jgi:FemAB-related protein (PEP-CTERM system-associated)